MKHAILLVAHGDFPHLVRLLNRLDTNCQVYIHLDRKMRVSKQAYDTLSSLPVVKGIYRRYKINWAGFNMLKAILYLLKEAFNDEGNGYFHLLSGQDYPVKPVSEFTRVCVMWTGDTGMEIIRLIWIEAISRHYA